MKISFQLAIAGKHDKYAPDKVCKKSLIQLRIFPGSFKTALNPIWNGASAFRNKNFLMTWPKERAKRLKVQMQWKYVFKLDENTSTMSVEFRCNVWVHWVSGPVDRSTHFKMGLILGTVLKKFLVFPVRVLRSSQNGSELHPDLWIEKKLIQLWHCG